MTTLTTTWNKPAYERHAHVGDVLRKLIGSVPKAAIELCLYLFEHCIDGKFEEIELYELPLGEARRSDIRGGKRYARNTLREALKCLVNLDLVIIRKNYGRGVFSLTISHPGGKRPFSHTSKNLTQRSNFRPYDRKTDKSSPETRMASSPITEVFRAEAEHTEKIDPGCFPPSPRNERLAPAPPCKGQAPSAFASLTLDTEPPPPLENNDHKGKGEGMCTPLSEEEFAVSASGCEARNRIDSDVFDNEGERRPKVNLESREILTALREVVPLNPQLKDLVLKFTFDEMTEAIALYQKRKKNGSIKNPAGWIVEALRRGRRSKSSGNRAVSTEAAGGDYPSELLRWYDWACRQGIVDGRALHHCPRSSPGSPARTIAGFSEDILLPVTVPDPDRRSYDPPYTLTPWREAMARFPISGGDGGP